MEFNEQEINEFKTESFELLDFAENNLLNYDSSGDYQTTYNGLFRAFHSLKGSCGMMGLIQLQELLHRLENLLVSTKDNLKISKSQMEIFLEGIDKSKKLFQELSLEKVNNLNEAIQNKAENENSTDLSEAVLEYIAECNELSARLSVTVQKIEKKSYTDDDIDSLYRDMHTLKGSSYLFSFNQLGDLGHAIESSLDPIRRLKISPSTGLIDHLFKCIDLIDQMILQISQNKPLNFEEQITKSILTLSLLGQKQEAQAENLPTNSIVEKIPTQESLEMKVETNIQINPVQHQNTEADKESASSIRVPVSLLDKLMTLMGEMVLVRNQVIQYSNKTDDLEFLNLSQRLNVITGEIQGEMMKTRMQPIGNVLTKFTRVVRDLSKELGKKIEINLSGTETELDKTLLEAVKDPLTHIIRNSCDHGIENPDERKKNGKSETGLIHVKSYHEGGQVIVEVLDDGKGLDKDRILTKATENGLILKEKIVSMSEREIFNLVFAPGFSTSQKVTNVSGRGVGMDVVKTNIEKIGGTVEISSQMHKGTSIKLKIPLTLAIVPALIVKSSNEHFAIPQLKLVELVRVENNNENEIEYIQGNPVYRLRGQILPLVSLNKVLGYAAESKTTATNIIILKSEEYVFGLMVDEVQDTADIVVKPLSRFLKSIEVYSGATVLGDGSVALILDVAGLAKNQLLDVNHTNSLAHVHDKQENQKLLSEIQDFLLIKVNSNVKHAILLNYVHRLEEFKVSEIEQTAHRKIIRYRDSILPLISINEVLDLKSVAATERDVISVIVIEKTGITYGLIVDEILDVLKTDKELDTTVTEDNGIIGNLVTDQEVITVIDPYKIINNSTKSEGAAPVENIFENKKLISNKQSIQLDHQDRILFVEDTVFFRRHVSKALEKAGYKVSCAKDGQEALEILESRAPDYFSLVLSDIEMPIMNGFKLAQAIRKHRTLKNLPLIALSTRSDEKHVQEGMKSGFNLYLEKMNVEQLLKSIEQLKMKESA